MIEIWQQKLVFPHKGTRQRYNFHCHLSYSSQQECFEVYPCRYWGRCHSISYTSDVYPVPPEDTELPPHQKRPPLLPQKLYPSPEEAYIHPQYSQRHNNVATFMYTSTCTIRWLSHSTLSCKASTDCVQWSVRISGFFCPQFGSQILVGGVRRGEEGRVWWIIISLTRIHAYMCRLRWWRKTRMGQVGVSREQNFVWMCSVKV